MTRDGGDKPGDKPGRHSPRAGRRITEEEAELWESLGRSLDKVKKKARVPAHADVPADAPAAPSPDRQPKGGHRAPQGVHSRPPPAPRAPPAQLPPRRHPAPADIDRRTLRQVGSGKMPIDAVLDLHGMRQEAAHGRLRAFLRSCQAKGLRMVLVITGKGAKTDRADARFEARFDAWSPGGAERGVLRRTVPMWLDEPELRAMVVSYAAAGVRHGGEGALYIRLRKARDG
jgi:DNA-nicking Smr family endonuclease